MSKASGRGSDLKILVVHCKYRIPGGEDTAVKNDIRLLRDMGHEVSVYIKSNDILDKMSLPARLGVAIGYVWSPAAKKKYRQLIEERRPDVIWVHNTLWMIGTAIYEAALECDVPVIQTVHNFRLICPCGILYREDRKAKLTGERCRGNECRECPVYGLHNSIKNKCYRDNRLLTVKRQRRLGIYGRISFACLSELQRDILLDAGIGIDSSRVYIKSNHTDTDIKWRAYSERDNTFIYAGRLSENKGIYELLEAWRILECIVYINDEAGCPGLIICGDGEMSEYVAEFIKNNDLKKVDYIGKVDLAKVTELLSKAKALIYPTKLLEGHPMSITEAYSVGTPVIVPDMGSAGDMVDEGQTGRHMGRYGKASDMVNIISNWDKTFEYNEETIRKKEEEYSPEAARKAVSEILLKTCKQV